MSAQISSFPAPALTTKADVNRRSANFPPSIWGDHFLSYSSTVVESNERIEHTKLKAEVKKMLTVNAEKLDATRKLELIDAIQRLGVSYHFEREIDEILELIYGSSHEVDDVVDNCDNLYTTSLKFRLLRQQGYKISCDVLNKFGDGEGSFKKSHIDDARGMLSLYEASQLRVRGEDLLDEADAFTSTHLAETIVATTDTISSPLVSQISHALKQPLRKGLPRLEARHYISIYENDASRDETLLAFAKIDFNMLQKLHQKELSDITKWWKELDFSQKLPFARDRIVECYFWILGMWFEPEYVFARKILTKVIFLTSVMDDIFDVFGTPGELELFNTAIERWDTGALDQLPDYMKVCYKAVLDAFAELEESLINEGRSSHIHYAKEAMKSQVRAYFQESKWFHQGRVPTFDEYMSVALVSSGYPLLAAVSFVVMGDVVSKEILNWVLSRPKIVRASAIIARLMDDVVSRKFEQTRGHVASSVECYMEQHGGTEEEAIHVLQEQVRNAWKDINEECLRPTAVPATLLTRILNLARVMDVLYKDGDGYTHSGVLMKHSISSLLLDTVPMSDL